VIEWQFQFGQAQHGGFQQEQSGLLT